MSAKNTPSATNASAPHASEDEKLLHSMGYAQELLRRMSGFSNFAISFSIICILAGGITSLQLGTSAVGGAAAGIVWPIGVGFCFLVALCMAQIASAFPTAGGLYHWSSILGGKGWGWSTAWFNLGGLIFVTAAVDVGVYSLFVNFVGPMIGIDPAKLTVTHQIIGVSAILISQATLNHFGIRAVTLLTDFSGYLIFVVAIVLTIAMLIAAPTHDFSRLFTFSNMSGDSGGGVWPESTGGFTMFLLALMWPIYTITGYDASAHTSEETVDAARNVPKGILRSVYLSGLFGWVMVSAFVIALPSIADGAKQGGNIFPWLMEQVLPGTFGKILWIGIVVSNFLCGLACVTSTSRMIYAFARDGGLPASSALRKVSSKWKTPVAAIWTTAALALASTLYAPAYSTLTTACVIFLYISYVMPTAAGFFTFGKSWTKMGPFNIGATAFKALAVVSVLGVALLVWIGVQPPNDKALTVTLVTTGLLVATWWLGVRKSFRGPPVMSATATTSKSGFSTEPQFVGK
ncbi:MAG: amino acid permease [Verrucomicrobia bacterium]|nr:amino acid permease [Verrucomicrobiota bacterium]